LRKSVADKRKTNASKSQPHLYVALYAVESVRKNSLIFVAKDR